eukprot:tig00001094_g6995.t1
MLLASCLLWSYGHAQEPTPTPDMASITYGIAKLRGSTWWVAVHDSGEVVPLTNLDEAMNQPIVHGCTAFDTERVQFLYQTPQGFIRVVDIRDGTWTEQRVPYLRSNWEYHEERRTIYGLASRWISAAVGTVVSTLTTDGGGADSSQPALPTDRSALIAFEIDLAQATAKYIFPPELAIVPGPSALNPATAVYYCTMYNGSSGENLLVSVAVENGTARFVAVPARVTSLNFDPERSRVVALGYDTSVGRPQVVAYDADTGRRQRYLEQDLEYVHPFRTSFYAGDGTLLVNSIDPGPDSGANIQFESIEYDTVNWFRKRKVTTSAQLLYQITRPGYLFEGMAPRKGGIRGSVEVLVGGYSVPSPNQFAKLNLTCRISGRAPESELNFTVEGKVTGIRSVGRENFVQCVTPDAAELSRHYPRLADPFFPQTPYQPVAVNLSVATEARTYFTIPVNYTLTGARPGPPAARCEAGAGASGGGGGRQRTGCSRVLRRGVVLVVAAAALALVACCPLSARWFRPSRVADAPRTLASDGKGDAPLAEAEKRPVGPWVSEKDPGVGVAPPAGGLFVEQSGVQAISAPKPAGRFWLPPTPKEGWADPPKPPGQPKWLSRAPEPLPREGGGGPKVAPEANAEAPEGDDFKPI